MSRIMFPQRLLNPNPQEYTNVLSGKGKETVWMRRCLQILQKEDYPRLPSRLHPIIWGLKRKGKKVGLEIKDTGRRGETEAMWDPKESVCSVSSEMFRDGRTPDCSKQGSRDPDPTHAEACLPPRWSWKQIVLWSLQKGQQPSRGLDFSLLRLKQWDHLSPLDFCSMELPDNVRF